MNDPLFMNDALFGPPSRRASGVLLADDGEGVADGTTGAPGDAGDVRGPRPDPDPVGPEQIVSAQAVPGQAVPGQAVPEQVVPAQTVSAQLLPWSAGAFALVLADAPANGALAVLGPAGERAILAQARMLHGDGRTSLIVVQGPMPAERDDGHALSVSGGGDVAVRPLRFTPARFDRTVATLIGQAMTATLARAAGDINWQPLSRFLHGVSAQAVRAEVSLPIGDGLALLLDGLVGPAPVTASALAVDGGRMRPTTAWLAGDPQTGRTAVLLPVAGARYFVVLDDVLVEIACPAGATRTHLARAPDAPSPRPSEADVILGLVAGSGLEPGLRPIEALPAPHALGWRNGDGNSLAIVGGVAVEAGTVLFIACDGREHELSQLTVRDLARPAAPLFAELRPIAAFHPDPASRPERLHVVALLPRRVGAGVLHVGLANAADAGGWIRLLEPANAQTRAILRAWQPPPPADRGYLHLAASVRAAAARGPAVVVAEQRPAGAGGIVAVVVAVGLAGEAVERTVASLAEASQRSMPLLIVLSTSDEGFDATVSRLASIAEATGVEVGMIALAGSVGAAAALSAVLPRLAETTVAVLEAGAVVTGGLAAARSLVAAGAAADAATLVLGAGAGLPVAAVLPGPAGRAWIEAVDRRLATVPAMLRDLARVAAESGARVVRAAEFAVLPDADAALSLDGRVDQLLLEGRGAVAEHRGNA